MDLVLNLRVGIAWHQPFMLYTANIDKRCITQLEELMFPLRLVLTDDIKYEQLICFIDLYVIAYLQYSQSCKQLLYCD